MKDQALFGKPARECVVCHCTASNGSRKPIPGEPVIIAITPVMYRRGSGKGKLRNAPRVNVCEQCLSKAGTNGRLGWFQGESPLWDALRVSLIDCLTKMAEDDAFSAVQRPDWRNPETKLL